MEESVVEFEIDNRRLHRVFSRRDITEPGALTLDGFQPIGYFQIVKEDHGVCRMSMIESIFDDERFYVEYFIEPNRHTDLRELVGSDPELWIEFRGGRFYKASLRAKRNHF